jgi:hypothetical protein
MAHDPNSKSTWNRFPNFGRDEPEELPEKRCVEADHFSAWGETLCLEVEQKRDVVAIRQGQLLLLHKFFEWHNALDKHHRNRSGKKRHVCVFEIFERLYQRIQRVQLCLEPMITIYPPAPPLAPAQQVVEIGAVTLGEFTR